MQTSAAEKALFRAVFTLTEKEYIRARVMLERRFGRLGVAPLLAVIGAALMISGGTAFVYNVSSAAGIVLALLLAAGGVALLYAGLSGMPDAIRRAAQEDYREGLLASRERTVTLNRDVFSSDDGLQEIRGYYSEQSACLETKELLIVVRGNGGSVIIPKRALDEPDRTCDFLRSVFAGRYRRAG